MGAIATSTKEISVANPSSTKIPSLDGLRAISICLVLVAHLQGTSGFPIRTLPFMTGYFGVRVFFVISGFLITTLLLTEQDQHGRISLRNFYIRRVLRIFPAFYAFLAIVGVLVATEWAQVEKNDLLHALTYTTNYHYPVGWIVRHTWSLAVEEQFYLLWPAVLAFAGVRRGFFVALATIAIVPILRILTLQWVHIPGEYFGFQFHLTADALATGCLLAISRKWLGSQHRYLAFLRGWLFPLVPVLAVLPMFLTDRPRLLGLFGVPLMNVAIAVTIDRVTRLPVRFLNSAPLRFIGVLSYSLYIWQQVFLNHDSTSWVCAFPQNVVLALGAACASYYVIEKPFLKLKHRFS